MREQLSGQAWLNNSILFSLIIKMYDISIKQSIYPSIFASEFGKHP